MFLTGSDISREFGVEPIVSEEMTRAITRWDAVSSGDAPWVNPDDGVESVNLAKLISDTRAKLISLDIGIAVSGAEGETQLSPRAEYLQGLADDLLVRLPDKLADAMRLGGMMIKWNGVSWDFVLPGDFGVTAKDANGDITGAIFASFASEGRSHYTRLEYHRFDGDTYKVTNRAYVDNSGSNKHLVLGSRIPLSSVPVWADMEEEVSIEGLEKPLFAYFRVPGSNTIDPTSPLGVSCFAGAMTELKAIDIAISRKNAEVEDSKHITFVGQALIKNAQSRNIHLPRFVKGLGMGLNDTETTAVHEHVPTLLTDARIRDINFDLSLAGVKCGFSEGVFVLDGQTGMITATQVEADDRDTIQTIKTDRDALRRALEGAFYGANALVSLYRLAPEGEYTINYNFGDITYSYAEDKATWMSYVLQGWVPKWLYFVKFEGMSEAEAKAVTAAATTESVAASASALFGSAAEGYGGSYTDNPGGGGDENPDNPDNPPEEGEEDENPSSADEENPEEENPEENPEEENPDEDSPEENKRRDKRREGNGAAKDEENPPEDEENPENPEENPEEEPEPANEDEDTNPEDENRNKDEEKNPEDEDNPPEDEPEPEDEDSPENPEDEDKNPPEDEDNPDEDENRRGDRNAARRERRRARRRGR